MGVTWIPWNLKFHWISRLMIPQPHKENMKRFVINKWDFLGQTRICSQAGLRMAWKSRELRLCLGYLWDRRDRGRVRVLSYGMWFMWFGISTSTKGGTSSFYLLPNIRTERGKGVMGLEICQQSNTENWIWLFITAHL